MQEPVGEKKKPVPWYADFRLFFFLFVVIALFMLKSIFGSETGCRGMNLTALNMTAPAAQVTRLDGSTLSLADLKGKVVFLNFWATWCRPCVEELPSIQGVFKKYEGNPDFQIVAVSCDETDDKSVVDFLADYNRKKAPSPLAFPIFHDRDHKAATAFNVNGFPTTFLIDKKGVVRKWFIGPRDYTDRHFYAMIDQLLAEKTEP